MKPTMGSLFAGIGGFDLGFERAGFEVKWQVEIDPWCRKVLAKHFPKAERFEDVRAVGERNLGGVDVICGGFPCQDVSVAGGGAGIKSNTRSGLWYEYARVIRELRPRFALVENVSGLLYDGLGVVLRNLAECGYDAEWESVSASDLGASHKRTRIWILAYPNSQRHTKSGGHFNAFNPKENPYREADSLIKHVQGSRLPYVCRRHDGISASVDRLRGLGNAVVPQIPEMYARRIREILEREDKDVSSSVQTTRC